MKRYSVYVEDDMCDSFEQTMLISNVEFTLEEEIL